MQIWISQTMLSMLPTFCGLFSIANAIEVCEGNDAAKLKFNLGKMRKHLADCFTNKLLPFPKAKCGSFTMS